MADPVPIEADGDEPDEREPLRGGPGGFGFDDALTAGDRIGAVWIAAGAVVDSVQIAYRNGHRTSRHGGYGGVGGWTELEPDELVLALSGWHAGCVEYLALHTTRRVIAAGRAGGGFGFHLAAPPGRHLIGLRGRCGWYLDAVAPIWAALPCAPARMPISMPTGPAMRTALPPSVERRIR